jgi:aminoglycoside N3'-acetyltransferase
VRDDREATAVQNYERTPRAPSLGTTAIALMQTNGRLEAAASHVVQPAAASETVGVVTKQQIKAGLAELGVLPGMGLEVHASLKAFGRVEGGATTVIDALQESVGPSGTLVLPSFNHGAAYADSETSTDGFNPKVTPTTNGAIPEAFWKRDGVVRSINPTHSFASWGRNKERYTAEHHKTLTMGADSPLGRLLEDDGWGLLLGVGYKSNTFHHCVETIRRAPCLGYRSEQYPVVDYKGIVRQARTWGWRGGSCPFTDTVKVQPTGVLSGVYGELMDRQGKHAQVKVGNATLTLFRLRDCLEVLNQIFEEGHGGVPGCSGCYIRPREHARTVESDWDFSSGCLKDPSLFDW